MPDSLLIVILPGYTYFSTSEYDSKSQIAHTFLASPALSRLMYCMLNFQIQLRVKMEWSEAMQKLRPSGGKPKWIPKHQRIKNSNSKARNAPVCSECGRPESKDATVPKFEEGGLEVPTCGKCEERAKNAQAFPSASEEGGSESASSQTLSARENLSKLDERLEMLRQDAGCALLHQYLSAYPHSLSP